MNRVGVQSYFLFNDTYTLVLIEYFLEARMQMIKSRVRPRAYLEEGHVLVMCPQRANEIKFNKKNNTPRGIFNVSRHVGA